MYDVSTLIADPGLREPLARAIREGIAPNFLRSVKLKITSRCNLKCVMCRYGKGLSLPELPTTRWLTALDEMAELGCRKVHFSGGEVLIRKDFEHLVARAASLGIKVTMTSNLTLLTSERAKSLMRSKISSISTSLDGASAKTHERVRGIEGSFRRTLKALGYIARERERRGRRTRLRVNFVMMRANFRDYPALVQLAAQHGATDVVPMPVDTKNPKLRLSKRLIAHYNAEIAPRVLEARQQADMPVEDALVYPFGRGRAVTASAQGRYAADYYQQHACYAPFLHMFVAWDGKVYLCCMTNGRIEPLGDLSSQSVRDVFLGDRFAAIRTSMMRTRLPACHACDMYLGENRQLSAVLPEASPGGKKLALPLVL